MKEETEHDLTKGQYRKIYAGYLTGRKICRVSLEAEAWFWRINSVVDDFGNMPADPLLVFQATAGRRAASVSVQDVERLVAELAAAGLLTAYEVAEETYLHIVGFESNQSTKNGKRVRRFPAHPPEPGCVRGKAGKSRFVQMEANPSNHIQVDTRPEPDQNQTRPSPLPAPAPRARPAAAGEGLEESETGAALAKAGIDASGRRTIVEALPDLRPEDVEKVSRSIRGSTTNRPGLLRKKLLEGDGQDAIDERTWAEERARGQMKAREAEEAARQEERERHIREQTDAYHANAAEIEELLAGQESGEIGRIGGGDPDSPHVRWRAAKDLESLAGLRRDRSGPNPERMDTEPQALPPDEAKRRIFALAADESAGKKVSRV